jgi:DamX protein
MFRDNVADFAFFMDEERDAISKKLSHLVDYTKLILFVQGVSGSGKTALLKQRFIRGKKENWQVAVVDAATCKDNKELLKRIAQGFQLDGDLANIESVVQQLDGLRQQKQIPLLVIDNAEQMDKSIATLLAELSIRQQGLPALLRLVMFGQHLPKPLHQAIDQAGKESGDEQLNSIILPALNARQTKEYIEHCLRNMDNADTALFNDAAIASIYEKSGGLIPRINELSNRIIGGPEKIKAAINVNKKANTVGLLQIIAATLVITILASTFFLGNDDDDTTVATQDDANQVTTELGIPQEGSQGLQRHSVSINSQRNDSNLNGLNAPSTAPQPVTALAPAPETLDEPPVEAMQKLATAPVEELLQEAESEATINAITSSTESNTVEEETTAAEPAPTKIVAATPPTKRIQKVVETEAIITASFAQKLKASPSNYYTLQLTASGREQAVKDFIKRHQLGDKAGYVHSLRDGKNWYSVAYGLYPTRTLASDGVKELPASLQKNKPWIRTIAGLQ